MENKQWIDTQHENALFFVKIKQCRAKTQCLEILYIYPFFGRLLVQVLIVKKLTLKHFSWRKM